MAELRICRICLATRTKLYTLGSCNLKSFYLDLLPGMANEDVHLPQHVCYECAALLQKFHTFQKRCYSGLHTLNKLHRQGLLTYEDVSQIDRKSLCLQLSVEKITNEITIFYGETMDCEPENYLNKNILSKLDTECRNSANKVDLTNVQSVKVIEVNFTEDIEVKDEPCEENTLDLQYSDCSDSHNVTNHSDNDTDSELPLNVLKLRENNLTTANSNKRRKKAKLKSKTKSNQKKKQILKTKKLKICFQRRKGRKPSTEIALFSDPSRWKVVKLTEEEAMKEFRSKIDEERYLKAEHKCMDCFKFFLTALKLSRHKKLRHSENSGSQECRFCKVRYKLPNQLTKHIQSHYMKYTCSRCNFVCSLKNTAFYHDETHKGLHKTCQHCGKQFRHTSTYYTHLRVAHKWSFTCLLCGAQFINQVGLRMHNQRMHFDKDESKSKQDEIYCEKCDIRFESSAAFDQHFAGSSNHPEKHKLSRNGSVRLRKKPSKCHQCGECFGTQAEYFSHHRKTHPGTSMYDYSVVCEICGASIKPGSVKAHSNSHTKERLFPCDTCGRQFTTLSVMKSHLLTHTGEKPHQCTLCEKRFTQRGSMMLHFRTFHLKQPYPKRNRNKKVFLDAAVFPNREK